MTTRRLDLSGSNEMPALTAQNLIDTVSKHTPTYSNFEYPIQQQQIYGRFNKPDVILPVSGTCKVDMKLCALYDNNKDFQFQWHIDNSTAPTVFIGVSGCG